MTVEAAIAVPVFLFFIMNLLVSFDILRLHGNIMGAMHQTGNIIIDDFVKCSPDAPDTRHV
mgnify:CR=1 FL=1